MDKISPIVITAKKAEDHLNGIKVQHADIVNGIQMQSMKVAQFNADKEAKDAIDRQQKEATTMENNKQQMESQTKILAEQNKAKELAIKEAALSS